MNEGKTEASWIWGTKPGFPGVGTGGWRRTELTDTSQRHGWQSHVEETLIASEDATAGPGQCLFHYLRAGRVVGPSSGKGAWRPATPSSVLYRAGVASRAPSTRRGTEDVRRGGEGGRHRHRTARSQPGSASVHRGGRPGHQNRHAVSQKGAPRAGTGFPVRVQGALKRADGGPAAHRAGFGAALALRASALVQGAMVQAAWMG